MTFERYTAFQLISYQSIDQDEHHVFTLLYQPIIGAAAYTLYLSLVALQERNKKKEEKYIHRDLFDLLKISPNDFLEARKKLEALGLLVVYQNEDLYLYELMAPLSAEAFIKDGSLGAFLFNEVGETQFNFLINLFRMHDVEKQGFKNITSSFDEVFQSIPAQVTVTKNFQQNKNSTISLKDNHFDFELFLGGLSKNFVDKRKITSRIKEKIARLSYVYQLDEFTMQKVFMDSVDQSRNIDIEKLQKNAEYWFRFEHKDKEEERTLVEGNQEIISLCKKENPLHLLGALFDSNIATTELRTIETLLANFDLKSEVINFLLVYGIGQTGGTFPSYNYFEKIAVEWQRAKVKTLEDALAHVKRRKTKQEESRKKSYKKEKNVLPKDIESDWLEDYIDNL
jgi:replication initiation and membrane attachment protein